MASKRHSLLWLDDEIASMSEYVEALEEHGFDVTVAIDFAAALSALSERAYDVVLSDIRMPEPSGIEFLKKAHETQSGARFGAFSSYLYLKDYRTRLENLGFDVQPIDKQALPPDSMEFEDLFIRPLLKLAKSGVTDTITGQNARADKEPSDPFGVSLQKFLKLSVVEKDQLSKLAGDKAKSVIDAAFADGKEWILLCGNDHDVRKSGLATDPPLTNEEAMHVATRHGKAPYLFNRGYHTEDMASSWSGCGESSSFRWYPTVRLLVGGETLDIHFDTGSPICLLSYEELRRLNVVDEPVTWGRSWRQEGEAEYLSFGIELDDVYVCSQTDTQKKLVTIRGQAVRDWWSTPFTRLCGESPCERYPDDGHLEGECPERRGMIGRVLLTDNDLTVVLDGQLKATSIRGDDAPE